MSKKKKKSLLITGIIIILLFSTTIGGYEIIKSIGKGRLFHQADAFQSGQVNYQGSLYEYNPDIITFLLMGIDKGKETIETYEIDNGGGGQADALFLAVVDTKEKTLKVININRNTMVPVSVYDQEGNFRYSQIAQITLQHGYGDGREQSCEYQLAAVSNLFYNIPIHGYAAISAAAIPAINDSVGGVEVVVLEDLSFKDASLVEGAQVRLLGESAYWYIKYRDIDVFASVDSRMARQRQYLDCFIDTAKQTVKKNPLSAIDIYQAVMPQIVTDLSIPEAVYLASVLQNYEFDENSCLHLTGETIMGELYEEFYPDETALYEMILDLFYLEKDRPQ